MQNDLKQLNRRQLMALGSQSASAELRERADRVAAGAAVIARLKEGAK